MTGRELLKENEGMLRQIIRSIDKNLDYSVIDSADIQAPRFALQLSWRGREATVSLSIDDLRSAGTDLVRKNAIRQKIKRARDNAMENYGPDVMGKKINKMLAQSRVTEENFKRPVFRRQPTRR